MTPMQLRVASNENGIYRISCAGAIRVPDFGVGTDPLEEAVGPEGFAGTLLLNCEEANSIDSSGVSWLLRCHKRYRQAGGVMVLHSLPPLIINVLNLLRMEKVLHWADTETAAEGVAQKVLA